MLNTKQINFAKLKNNTNYLFLHINTEETYIQKSVSATKEEIVKYLKKEEDFAYYMQNIKKEEANINAFLNMLFEGNSMYSSTYFIFKI